MKKPMKIIYLVLTIVAAVLLVFGVARLVSADDVIGEVVLTTTEEFTGDPIFYETGDYNKDGQVNSNDAIYLLMYTQFNDKDPSAYPIYQSGDINKDGNINSDDAIYLLMYTQFPENYPILASTGYE